MKKHKHLLIGVDGGGTKSVLRLETQEGFLLGEMNGGPANIRNSVEQSWQSIMHAFYQLTNELALKISDYQLHAGMGLAGTEYIEAYNAFINFPHIFDYLVVKSDAHVGCLAAHAGHDGGIIIVGTGVVGLQIIDNEVTKVGGWGFPHDDEGSGAWIGLQAIKAVLHWLDKRMPESVLAQTLFNHFNQSTDQIMHWTTHANSTDYARLAPLVIQQSKLGDEVALNIVKQAAKMIDHLGITLIEQSLSYYQKKKIMMPISLIGGIAPFLKPYLSEKLKSHMRPCRLSLAKGAILLINESLAEREVLC